MTHHGSDAFVLCGSQAAHSKTFDDFGSDVAIRINDTTAFGTAIARQIPGFRFGLEGACVYKAGPVECDIADFELEKMRQDVPSGTPKYERFEWLHSADGRA